VRYLSRYINKALNDVLEYLDFDFPQLWIMQHPTSKSFGDNPDATYIAARLEGSRTYRIVGDRGTASWLRFVLTPYEELVGGSVLTGANIVSLSGQELVVDENGSFELILSAERRDGNWMQLPPGKSRLLIRQFFGNWDLERPLTARIEQVGKEGQTPSELTAERMVTALRDVNDYITRDSDRWYRWSMFYKQMPNSFYKGRPTWAGGTAEAERNIGRWLNIAYWMLDEDEAAVVEFAPPDVGMWLFELDTFWMTSVDYRYHFSSINSAQAVADPDGVVRLVIANQDPNGAANWLDPAGHREGLIMGRWIDPAPGAENVTPTCTIVKLADLDATLPSDTSRVSADGRVAQWRRQRDGVMNRFGLGR
jgi:hypothetical protein